MSSRSRTPLALQDSPVCLSHIGAWCDSLRLSPFSISTETFSASIIRLAMDESRLRHAATPPEQHATLNRQKRDSSTITEPSTRPHILPVLPQGCQRSTILQNLLPMQRWLSEIAADGPWQAIEAATKIHPGRLVHFLTAHQSAELSDTHATCGDPSSSKLGAARPRDGG